MKTIFSFLDTCFEEAPASYGIFHIISLLCVIGVTVFLCIRFSSCSDKTLRRIALISWIIVLVLEIYKQLVFTVSLEDSEFVYDFQWYAFPFQFCSSPLYVLPFIAFLPSEKYRDVFIGFMATFSLFAGIAVMLYPGDVFIRTIGIDIQTMVHHGSQVALGIFFAVHFMKRQERASLKRFCVGAVATFTAMLIIAMVMNIIVYHAFLANGIDETFNMFYISPYFDCTLPVLSGVYATVPYPVFLAIYIIGFSFVAAIILLIQQGIFKLVNKRKAKSL